MMKFWAIFIMLVCSLGCTEDQTISEFESILGKDKSATLTQLVLDFENEFLATYYADLIEEEAYKAFLFDVQYGDFPYWKKISDSVKHRFREHSLGYDVYQIPDSVWVVENSQESKHGFEENIVVRRKYTDASGKIKYSYSPRTIEKFRSHKDTILKRTRHYSLINLEGNYTKALEAISSSSEFLEDYVDRRKGAGKFSPPVLVHLIQDYDVDVTDYIIKRIIVVDILF
ncbi:MAG: hypothetical protein KTR22_08740 [Flavobacteriaceae bacterium]|nr:hypothetical protein [Flavobacteriaceae bacterium]